MIVPRDSEEYKKQLAKMSRRELFFAYNSVDRKKNPGHYKMLRQEIAERDSVAEAEQQQELPDLTKYIEIEGKDAPEREMKLRFNGSPREYFRVWIVNLCLSLLTFGIFSAWAKVRKKRYFYSNLTLDGTPFQYLAKPLPILKGRLIAAILFSIYYLTSHFFTAQLPYVLLVGAILAPWVIVQSAAFNAKYSAYRNMSFRFDGNYLDAVRLVSFWGIVPILIVGFLFSWWGKPWIAVILFVPLGLFFPWWMCKFKNFIITKTSYGEVAGSFSATGGDFFSIYFRSGLILMAVGIVAGGFTAAVIGMTGKSNLKLLPLFTMLPIYAGYILAFAFTQAGITNTVWNNIRLGPVRFHSTLGCFDLLKLYVTNAIGIVFSAGLLIPWAVVRTIRYRVEQTRVASPQRLDGFRGSPVAAVSATGSELGEFFDLDLSI